ncbi:MAG: PAS domain S-box protein [Proteobacteria bacterium]|nr:PAS domain S-box protein [Pseudomonadota bacterium]
MHKKPVQQDSDQLRRAAEAKLAGEQAPGVSDRSADELLHELQVHQAQLEMQNENLREAHLEMEASRDRYVDLYDFSPISYLTLSSAGTISEANLTAADMFVAERHKLIKRRFANFVVPEDIERWHLYFLCVKQSDEQPNCELSLRRADGCSFYVHLNARRMDEGSGGYTVRIALTDITERKQQELELRKFKAIIESSDDAIISKTLDDIIVSWNHSAEKIFGYTAQEAIGHSILMLIPLDRQNEEVEILARITRGERVEHYETLRRHKDGRLIDISTTFSPIQDINGKVIGTSKIARDITEHKHIENELRIAATAFNSHEGMAITDAKGTILRVNQAYSKITGYAAEEITGQNQRILKSGRHDVSFYEAMWDSINNTGAWEGEIWNRRKNGEVYPEHLTIAAVKTSDGVVVNYVSTLTDITLTKAAEDEIKHLAFYDPLTGLPNRRLFNDRLSQVMSASRRSGLHGALIFLDLDNFKPLNDTHGHGVGDLLLIETAAYYTLNPPLIPIETHHGFQLKPATGYNSKPTMRYSGVVITPLLFIWLSVFSSSMT